MSLKSFVQLFQRPENFKRSKPGEIGIAQVISSIPTSYPGNSILTDDLISIEGTDDCSCGRKGVYFDILGRLKASDPRDVVIHTDIKINKLKYNLLAGNEPERVLKEKPFEIFDTIVIKFLSKLSQKLLSKNLNIEKYRDFKGFGFWVRESNLKNMRNSRKDINCRVGRGVSFHSS